MRDMPDASVDAVVTDPPYGLSFMGRKWDYDVPSVEIWAECLRVLKPGGHLLAFAGTRTQHRMCCRIEDAGFEIRDMIAWVYGSGFPKSHNLGGCSCNAEGDEHEPTCRSITEAEWRGWGTALKPALEPITVARKPLIGTVAENVLTYGTGAINVDGCRVGSEAIKTCAKQKGSSFTSVGNSAGFNGCSESIHSGRWPANLIHDGSEEATAGMGECSRYFYCPKASKADRDEGCGDLEMKRTAKLGVADNDRESLDPVSERFRTQPSRNNHPTVKPTALMRYLCRLVTPPGGVVLDPFTGSGSTGKAARLEGFRFIGIEREPEYVEIAKARIEAITP